MMATYLLTPNFATTILGAVMLYLLPLRHRKNFLPRVMVGCVIFLLGGFLLRLYVTPRLTAASYVLHILLGAFFVCFSCEVSIPDALMASVCGLATQFWATSVTTLLCPKEMMPSYGLGMSQFPQATPATVGIHMVLYLVAGLIFARKMTSDGAYHMHTLRPIISAVVLMVFAMYMNSRTRMYYYNGEKEIFGFGLIYGILCSFLYLCMQLDAQLRVFSATQVEVERVLRAEQRKQYENSKRSVELINQRCHELKLQLAALRSGQENPLTEDTVRECEESVMIYDAAVHTGNPTLDTVLTEKSLVCNKSGINWTCMADGKKLFFMEAVDLYILFGHLLDNAITRTETLNDQEKRVLAVTICERSGMVFLQIENYSEDTACTPIDPAAIQIIQKYDGTADTEMNDSIQITRVLFPIPQK